MFTLNGWEYEGCVRGCYDSTPQEVDVHRLTMICASLLRSYPALVIAKIRPTLVQVLLSVLLLPLTLLRNPTKHEAKIQNTTVVLTVVVKNTRSSPYPSARENGYLTKLFSTLRNYV